MTTVIQVIACLIQQRLNCIESVNTAWRETTERRLTWIEKNVLPSGAGIDCGTKIDLDRSTGSKIVLTFEYHHMREGCYDGWTDHIAIVRPAFGGIDMVIGGRNRNDCEEYFHQIFDAVLGEELDEKRLPTHESPTMAMGGEDDRDQT